ncbi:hypothetical protein [Cohnella sp. GCM10012308]|uniref:hypothetical protein n=1 Tax=Cohnella sp. GCM10012308 TaxID=3317329 RepID=UPI00361D3807
MQPSIIELNKIVRYLLQNGWHQNYDFPNKNMYVFFKSLNDDPAQDTRTHVVLPAKETFVDYPIKLNDTLESLSIIEDRKISDIIKEILSPSSDNLEIRIISKFSENGTIPLNYASRLIQGLKNLIISSANTEENPRPFFKRPSFRAKKFGELFSLGQTSVGSYIVNIESGSLEDENLELYVGEEGLTTAPFSRRIVQRIHNSMLQVKKFNQPNYKLGDYLKNGYLFGLNANICEALIALFNDDESVKIETRIKYSSYLEKSNDFPEFIQFNNADYHTLKMIANAFREQENEVMIIEGKISKLSTKEELQSTAYGVITIDYIEDGSKRSVRVELNEDQYKVACDAHKLGKRIQAIGILDFSKKSWEIVQLEKFTIL